MGCAPSKERDALERDRAELSAQRRQLAMERQAWERQQRANATPAPYYPPAPPPRQQQHQHVAPPPPPPPPPPVVAAPTVVAIPPSTAVTYVVVPDPAAMRAWWAYPGQVIWTPQTPPTLYPAISQRIPNYPPPPAGNWTYPPAPGSNLSLHASRIGWLLEPGPTVAKSDYVYTRETKHFGDMLNEKGFPVARVMDIVPHEVHAGEGLRMCGANARGKFTQDDRKTEYALGTVDLGTVRTTMGKGVSAKVCVNYFAQPLDDAVLFHLGNGWDDIFQVKHDRGNVLKFQVTPGAPGEGCTKGVKMDGVCGWNDRASVDFRVDDAFLSSGIRTVVAVLEPSGKQRLYVDGALVGQGDGIALPRGAADPYEGQMKKDGEACERRECWLGRWMRPDQSSPLYAGIVSLDLFDDALTPEQVAEVSRPAA